MKNIYEIIERVENGTVWTDLSYDPEYILDGEFIAHHIEGHPELQLVFREHAGVTELKGDAQLTGDDTPLIDFMTYANDLEDIYDYSNVIGYMIDGSGINWIY